MSPENHRRLLQRAIRWTIVLALPFAFLVAQVVYSYVQGDASGAYVFFLAGVYAMPATLAAWHLWRRARRARPEKFAAPDITPTTDWVLGGQDSPPTRW
ncbi:MAG TPA: hypothetical protein VNR62_11425 [Cellulomonas sp.]|nr:hypothetical protein [Cellulomonas sp.]